MSMTLKEFSKNVLSADTAENQKATWRRVFPTELLYSERVVKVRLFRPNLTRMVLQEKWERIHKGDVIDIQWKDVAAEYIPSYDYY